MGERGFNHTPSAHFLGSARVGWHIPDAPRLAIIAGPFHGPGKKQRSLNRQGPADRAIEVGLLLRLTSMRWVKRRPKHRSPPQRQSDFDGTASKLRFHHPPTAQIHSHTRYVPPL